MKKTGIIVLVFLLTGTTQVFSQEKDPKAKVILDKVSTKNKAYSSVFAEFDYILENKAEGINEKQEGEVLLQGDKYKLEIAGQLIISDGKTVWTYIEDADEVQINNAQKSEDAIDPSNIFTIWEKGFKYKYEGDDKVDGKAVKVINLYPEKPDGKNYHTVILFVDPEQDRVLKMTVKGKEGNNYIYKIKEFTPNASVKALTFTFNTAGVDEVIDLRE